MRWSGTSWIVGVAWVVCTAFGAELEGQEDNGYTNLRVLPSDISRAELGQVMLDHLAGLGLPRRAGEGCLHCHAGSLEVPRSEWDYASDEKPAKEQARVMMAMVRAINEQHLASLDGARGVEVGCTTCHAGRLNPMPLGDLLLSEYDQGGIASLESTYRAARARYYEADAYDFRLSTLIEVAGRLATSGEEEDAARVHQLNIEYSDDPAAHAGLMRLRLLQALDSGGNEAMLARYAALKEEHPEDAFQPLVLDGLAWQLYRSDRQAAALLLFELNFTEHPASFPSHESLAYAVFDQGDQTRGLEIARRWLEGHPDHRAGRQLLTELERMRGGV